MFSCPKRVVQPACALTHRLGWTVGQILDAADQPAPPTAPTGQVQ